MDCLHDLAAVGRLLQGLFHPFAQLGVSVRAGGLFQLRRSVRRFGMDSTGRATTDPARGRRRKPPGRPSTVPYAAGTRAPVKALGLAAHLDVEFLSPQEALEGLV